MQLGLFGQARTRDVKPFRTQLLKWVGNKQRFADEIASYFPEKFGMYFEPFLGSGAVLGTLRPDRALASDTFKPLIEIWQTLKENPATLKHWYAERYAIMTSGDKVTGYERIKASYNAKPNGADLLFISRSCYGGVVRFRMRDGYCSTPCGVHAPVSPDGFSMRVEIWRKRVAGVEFDRLDYTEAMARAKPGDLIYCDPPYSHSQAILYGRANLELSRLLEVIADCKARVAYSLS